jgi:protoporphyrin/coproporphyrin ferrochelatase
MMPSGSCDGVLIIGFGGPTSSAEVRPFLDRVLKGRPVPPERYEEVVRHYERLGGRSPYNEITIRQAAALRESLHRQGVATPVAVGFRNSPPYLDDALAELTRRGVTRALGFILAAFRCEASWDRYQSDVEDARGRLGADAPEVDYPASWHDDPLFVEAVADRLRVAMARLDPDERKHVELVFTAHSIPVAMAEHAPYVRQLRESAAMIADAIAHPRWELAFQSRSGSPRERWLEPDIGDALRTLKGRAVVVMPLGFLCDHVEVLYDLDVEAARIAREAGVRMERAATVGDHPHFIEMMASIARKHLKA